MSVLATVCHRPAPSWQQQHPVAALWTPSVRSQTHPLPAYFPRLLIMRSAVQAHKGYQENVS